MNNSEDTKILAEEIIDFCNGLEALAVKLRFQVEKMLGIAKVEPKPKANTSEEAKFSWNPEAIKWQKVEGFRGEYERYPLEGEKAEATSDYKNLLEDLKRHDGRLTKNGYFYWLFEDSATIGRKKRKREAKG
jgi:hypothetical protein